MTAPLSAVGTRLELFGNPNPAGYATWGSSTWGNAGSLWWGPVWNDIACQVESFSVAWGADDALGVLAQSAAGSIELTTYDPNGLLDPANPTSTVDIGMRQSGTPLRIVAMPGNWIVRTGFLDSLSWDYATGKGSLSGSDAIALLAMANTTEYFTLPNPATLTPPSLFALVAAIIADTGLPLTLSTLGAEGLAADPQVAFPARKGASVNAWAAIKAAAIDALCFAWVDRFGTLRLSPLGYIVADMLGGVGSFEGYQAGTMPPGWAASGNTWTGPSGNAVDGANILRVSGDGIVTNPAARSPMLPVIPGALYTITAWGARMGGAQTARLYVDVPGVSSTIILNWTTGTSTMAKLTGTWQCPADGSVTAIQLRWTIPALAASTDIWYFDAATIVGPTVASSGVTLGDGGIALAELETTRTARGVYNVVSDQVGELGRDSVSVARYGPRSVSISDRREPAGNTWAAAILADRANATLEVAPGRVIPATIAELGALLNVGAGETLAIHLVDPARDMTATVLGGSFTGNAADGWRGSFRLYMPGSTWAYVPPDPSVVVGSPSESLHFTDQDAFVYIPPITDPKAGELQGCGGTNYLEVSGTRRVAGDTYANARALLRFRIDASSARRITSAIVRLWIASYPAQDNPTLFDFTPVLEDWPEGYTAGAPTPNSPIIWPGPAVDQSVAITLATGRPGDNTFAWIDYDLTPLIRPWLPIELGGDGLRQYGLRIAEHDETHDMRMIMGSRETTSGVPPRLVLLEV